MARQKQRQDAKALPQPRKLPRSLSAEEASMLQDFRALADDDRIAVRYLCNALRKVASMPSSEKGVIPALQAPAALPEEY